MQVYGKSYGQKINLNEKNASLEKVLHSIEKQTGYVFLYTNKGIKEARVTVHVTNGSIDETLKACFENSMITFKLVDKNILLRLDQPSPRNERSEVVQPVNIHGRVTDTLGLPLPGVSVHIKGVAKGGTVVTNVKGEYTIKADANATLVFSYVGFNPIEIPVQNRQEINVVLKGTSSTLKDVVVVAYGTQKKTTMISSITTIDPKELKGPTSNLTTMLAGKISGIISYQRSGEPGKDNASFFIRNIGATNSTPLILIDGIESSSTDLARLQPDDIAGFSILKDATATSVYGARGANGVILINTKIGESGKMKLNFRIENSTSANTKNISFADNITYMTLANEAMLTRNPLGSLPYDQNKIDHTARGDDPLLYPNNNWIQELIKNTTNNQRVNLNAGGGTDRSKYYIAMTYNLDNGNLKGNSINGFSNNIKLQSYSLLSNVNLNVTKTTEVLISLKGQFDSYNGPIGGGKGVYNSALSSNPVAFPAVYPANLLPYEKHPLFGNALMLPGNGLYTNPYARSLSGFQKQNTSNLTAQVSLKQNLGGITPGLSIRVMAYTSRHADFQVARSVSPYYYQSNLVNGVFTGLSLLNTGINGSPGSPPTEYLTYNQNPASTIVNSTTYGEAAINYSRVFNDVHSIGGLLIGTMSNYMTGNATDLVTSLPGRNQGFSGRFTYGYDNRYLIEYDFGYTGSERFAANHRFGFFPSIGAGWIVSNEKFFKPLLNTINQLKFRFTHGLSGNDNIGSANERFFYLSNVNLNGGNAGAFGTNFSYNRPIVVTRQYENRNITWQLTKQTNIGMDLTLFHDLNLTLDAYRKHVSNILLTGDITTNVPSSMGLQANLKSNSGINSGKGIEAALNYRKSFNNSLWLQTRGTFTYQVSKIIADLEPKYSANERYLSHVGNSADQIYGLAAERLFDDQYEVNNSPQQQFGSFVMGGDIKYRDINRDGKITNADRIPIGFPATPEIMYGFGFSFGYKNFDISAFFQGSARSSFLVNSAAITPFAIDGGSQNGLLALIANNHWSEAKQNSYAFWPRLDNTINPNNSQSSTWWLENGSFFRLKSAEAGYNIPDPLLKKLGLRSGRIYLNGTNLFALSAFKLWDPEMGASGLGYPVQRVFNVGIMAGF
ncbi:TonB-linked outer membrane protein, SusC/RagA family [Pedobacter steynii]|uniref:TonB-linked outer membrane protein, SusC/RagA family n=2 Tax=Pedobacter steynii TaxID=430522 RepID=A0A1H0G143_9SPHI|nr:TonB-dependent receptor [Pedobacter steynii]SDO00638.1 TonB-linked outer membrane protein, SusC/RagA family [Pedobacter steynii]